MTYIKPFKMEYITKIRLKLSIPAAVGGTPYFIRHLVPYKIYAFASSFEVTSAEDSETVIRSLPTVSKRKRHVLLEDLSIDNSASQENKLTESASIILIYDIPGKICTHACCDKDSSFCVWAINSKIMDNAEFAASGFKIRTSSQCDCEDAAALARWMIEMDKKQDKAFHAALQSSQNSK